MYSVITHSRDNIVQADISTFPSHLFHHRSIILHIPQNTHSDPLTMLAQQYGFLIFTSLLNTIFAAPTPSADSTTTVPNLSTITHLGPISFPFPLDFTVLSFNYYEDPNCKTLLGSTNVSSIDLAAKTCFALPGNSLVFTYQLHQGTLSVYNPKEVNSKCFNRFIFMADGGIDSMQCIVMRLRIAISRQRGRQVKDTWAAMEGALGRAR